MVLNIVSEAIAQGESVLVFFHSIPTLHYVKEKLQRRKYDVNVLEGDTPIKDRQKEVDRFNRTKKAVYLISTRVFPAEMN
jgi:SNF2 family DNA or RNA helicase